MKQKFFSFLGIFGCTMIFFFAFVLSVEAASMTMQTPRCCILMIKRATPDVVNRKYFDTSCIDRGKYESTPMAGSISFLDQCSGEGGRFQRDNPGTIVNTSPQPCSEVPACANDQDGDADRNPFISSGTRRSSSTSDSPVSLTIINPFQILDFTEEGLARGLGRIASFLLSFVGLLAFLMFVWGGFQWLTSSGDPEKVKSGVDTMKWAAIGTILAFGSFALLTYFLNVFRTQVNPPEKPAATRTK